MHSRAAMAACGSPKADHRPWRLRRRDCPWRWCPDASECAPPPGRPRCSCRCPAPRLCPPQPYQAGALTAHHHVADREIRLCSAATSNVTLACLDALWLARRGRGTGRALQLCTPVGTVSLLTPMQLARSIVRQLQASSAREDAFALHLSPAVGLRCREYPINQVLAHLLLGGPAHHHLLWRYSG